MNHIAILIAVVLVLAMTVLPVIYHPNNGGY